MSYGTSQGTLTVVNVAFPFAPVGPHAVGGAEQIVSQLDGALAQAGHCSLVLAAEGSCIFGHHINPGTEAKPRNKSVAWQAYRQVLEQVLGESEVDLVHMHGIDFHEYLPRTSVPVLATLHLPPQWYPARIFSDDFDKNVVLQCVSESQRATCPPCSRGIEVISNGVPASAAVVENKEPFVLMLGRICPEKGFHLGLEAAKRAGCPALLAGEVFDYDDHVRYFREQIVPRLDERRCFIGAISGKRKEELLARARCLLVPSLAPETSSLVAMEAIMAGTPAVAFRSGALRDIVEDGRTGFLAGDVEEMAAAIGRAGEISPRTCRERAMIRFDAGRMVREYFALYRQLGSWPVKDEIAQNGDRRTE